MPGQKHPHGRSRLGGDTHQDRDENRDPEEEHQDRHIQRDPAQPERWDHPTQRTHHEVGEHEDGLGDESEPTRGTPLAGERTDHLDDDPREEDEPVQPQEQCDEIESCGHGVLLVLHQLVELALV